MSVNWMGERRNFFFTSSHAIRQRNILTLESGAINFILWTFVLFKVCSNCQLVCLVYFLTARLENLLKWKTVIVNKHFFSVQKNHGQRRYDDDGWSIEN